MFNFIKNLFSPKTTQTIQEVPEYVKHINWPEAIRNFEAQSQETATQAVEETPVKPKRVRPSRAKVKNTTEVNIAPEVSVETVTETAPKPKKKSYYKPKKKVVETAVSE